MAGGGDARFRPQHPGKVCTLSALRGRSESERIGGSILSESEGSEVNRRQHKQNGKGKGVVEGDARWM